MVRLAFVAVIAALTVGSILSAHAQQQGPACLKRADLLQHLSKRYQEAPAAVGLADNGALLEVFASKAGETWTVTVTMPNGISCLIATGQQWQDLPRVAKLDNPT